MTHLAFKIETIVPIEKKEVVSIPRTIGTWNIVLIKLGLSIQVRFWRWNTNSLAELRPVARTRAKTEFCNEKLHVK